MGHLLLKEALLVPMSNPSWNSMTLVSSYPLAVLSFLECNGVLDVMSEVGLALREDLQGVGQLFQLPEALAMRSGASHFLGGKSWHLMLLPPGVKKRMPLSTRPPHGTPRASCLAQGCWKWAP